MNFTNETELFTTTLNEALAQIEKSVELPGGVTIYSKAMIATDTKVKRPFIVPMYEETVYAPAYMDNGGLALKDGEKSFSIIVGIKNPGKTVETMRAEAGRVSALVEAAIESIQEQEHTVTVPGFSEQQFKLNTAVIIGVASLFEDDAASGEMILAGNLQFTKIYI